MQETTNAFQTLATQAERGDAGARRKLENDFAFIVRRVLRRGAAASTLDRRILAEARRCGEDAGADPDQLVSRVASSLCTSVLVGFSRHERSTAETITGA